MGRDPDGGKPGERANKAEPAKNALARGADERVDDHDQNAERAKHHFRKEAADIGVLLVGQVHHWRTCLPVGAAPAVFALMRTTGCGLAQQMTGECDVDASRAMEV